MHWKLAKKYKDKIPEEELLLASSQAAIKGIYEFLDKLAHEWIQLKHIFTVAVFAKKKKDVFGAKQDLPKT